MTVSLVKALQRHHGGPKHEGPNKGGNLRMPGVCGARVSLKSRWIMEQDGSWSVGLSRLGRLGGVESQFFPVSLREEDEDKSQETGL